MAWDVGPSVSLAATKFRCKTLLDNALVPEMASVFSDRKEHRMFNEEAQSRRGGRKGRKHGRK